MFAVHKVGDKFHEEQNNYTHLLEPARKDGSVYSLSKEVEERTLAVSTSVVEERKPVASTSAEVLERKAEESKLAEKVGRKQVASTS